MNGPNPELNPFSPSWTPGFFTLYHKSPSPVAAQRPVRPATGPPAAFPQRAPWRASLGIRGFQVDPGIDLGVQLGQRRSVVIGVRRGVSANRFNALPRPTTRCYNLRMTVEILRDHLQRRPFVPFHVVTSAGQTYTVSHPENAILLRGGLVVAYGDGNGDLPEHVATLSLLHITAVETLPNGKPRRRRG